MERAGPPFPLRPLCSAYRAVARGKRGIGRGGRQLDIHVQLDLACTATNISTLQPPRSRHRAATRGRRERISPTVNPSAYTGEDCAAAHTSRHKATAATCRCHGHARRQRHRSTCSGGGGGVIINRGAAQRRRGNRASLRHVAAPWRRHPLIASRHDAGTAPARAGAGAPARHVPARRGACAHASANRAKPCAAPRARGTAWRAGRTPSHARSVRAKYTRRGAPTTRGA